MPPRCRYRAGIRDEEAVSPVVATILLLAIVITLGVVVWRIVNEATPSNPPAPTVAFGVDEFLDRLTVTTAEPTADWTRIDVRVKGCTQAAANSIVRLGTASPYQNTPAVATGGALNAAAAGNDCGSGTYVTVTATLAAMRNSDYLEFCGSPGGAGITNVRFDVVDNRANSFLDSPVFSALADC